MRTFAIILVILAMGAFGRPGKPRKDDFVSHTTDMVQGMLDECESSVGVARRLLRKNRGRGRGSEDSSSSSSEEEEQKPSKDAKFAEMFISVFSEDYCSELAGMDGAEVAQLLADRLYVDKFAKMTTKFIEQIREENCEAEEDLEVEEDLAVEEEREEVPSALRRFLHKRENGEEVPADFMTTFLEFFSEGYCSEKTSEELAIELGQAVLAGDVVFEGRGDDKDANDAKKPEETRERPGRGERELNEEEFVLKTTELVQKVLDNCSRRLLRKGMSKERMESRFEEMFMKVYADVDYCNSEKTAEEFARELYEKKVEEKPVEEDNEVEEANESPVTALSVGSEVTEEEPKRGRRPSRGRGRKPRSRSD